MFTSFFEVDLSIFINGMKNYCSNVAGRREKLYKCDILSEGKIQIWSHLFTMLLILGT